MPGKSDRAHVEDLLRGAFLKEGSESASCRNGRNDTDPEFLLEDLYQRQISEQDAGPIFSESLLNSQRWLVR